MAVLSQGITTVIVGQDGSSDIPVASYLEKLQSGVPVNVASYVGHGSVRSRVMGADFKRKATDAEVAKMREIVTQEMAAGALGLSSGLEYDPGIYSSREEVRALAKVAGDAGGRYISHIRSEDRAFWDAIDEIIEIGRINRMPVQVSHMKLAMTSIWGKADSLISLLDRSRAAGVNITADVYPYRFWQSGLTVLFPERNFSDRAAAEFALREVAQPDSITLTNYGANRDYNGKTVGDVARLRGTDPATTLIALIRESEQARAAGKPAGQTIIATSMVEPDIERIIKWPFANICTDGELEGRHPRGYGSFTRVLGHYVRERHVVGMAEAIRKMTSLAADNVGLRNRGRIVAGGFADLVLFDTATIADRATPAEPQAPSVGIRAVWVNGVKAFDNAAPTGSKSGRPIRRGE
jgi:N-acyl-D-amino-acid deacylase